MIRKFLLIQQQNKNKIKKGIKKTKKTILEYLNSPLFD